MNTKILFTIFLVAIFLLPTANAQRKMKIDKKIFNIAEEGFKSAWDNVKKGDREFRKGTDHFSQALNFYLGAEAYNPENARLNYKIGLCYLYTGKTDSAMIYLEKAERLEGDLAPDLYFALAKTYHLGYRFDKAQKYYEQFRDTLSPKQSVLMRKDIERKIEECGYAKDLLKKPVRCYIDNMGENINSPYSEFLPIFSPDDSTMLFTAQRWKKRAKRNPENNKFFEDIYISKRTEQGWDTAQILEHKLVSRNANQSALCITQDSTLYLYIGKKGKGDIYESPWKKGDWASPSPLTKGISTKKFHESSASITADGQQLFFVSNREQDNLGGHDIYFCKKEEKGKWSNPQNLGLTINTPYDEISVFVHPDGNSLYFCSNGHNTMGGYDIFVSEKNESQLWGKPENLGYPINSPLDEISILVKPDRKFAYIGSFRKNVRQADIFEVLFLGEEKPIYQDVEDQLLSVEKHPDFQIPIQEAIESTVLKGTIISAETSKPVSARVEIIDKELNRVIYTAMSDYKTGEYKVALPAGKNFSIAIKSPNYMIVSDNITVSKSRKFQTFVRNFSLNPIKLGAKLILKNVYFDSGKSVLRSESHAELDALIEFMKQNPNVKIEISGHTDSRGAYSTNLRLSRSRAQAVKDYIVEKGINAERLESVGYADKQPVADNSTDEGRQQNRRVEAKIIAK